MIYYLIAVTIIAGLAWLGFYPQHAQSHLDFIVVNEYWRVYAGVTLVGTLILLTMFSRVFQRGRILLSELKKSEHKNEKQKLLIEVREQELVDLRAELNKKKKDYGDLDRIKKDTENALLQKEEYLATMKLSLDGFLNEGNPLIEYVKNVIRNLKNNKSVTEDEINSTFEYIDTLVKYRFILMNTNELSGSIRRQRREQPDLSFDVQIKILDFITTHQHHLEALNDLITRRLEVSADSEKSPLCLCLRATESPYPDQLGKRLTDGVYLFPGISLTIAGFDENGGNIVGDQVYFIIALRNAFRNAVEYACRHYHDSSRIVVIIRNTADELIVTLRHRSSLSYKETRVLIEGSENDTTENVLTDEEFKRMSMGMTICQAITEGFQGTCRFKTAQPEALPLVLTLVFKNGDDKDIKVTFKLFRNEKGGPADDTFGWNFWTSLQEELPEDDLDITENRAGRLDPLPSRAELTAVENIAALSHDEIQKWQRSAQPSFQEVTSLMSETEKAYVIFDEMERRDPTWAILIYNDGNGWICRPEVTVLGSAITRLKFTHISD